MIHPTLSPRVMSMTRADLLRAQRLLTHCSNLLAEVGRADAGIADDLRAESRDQLAPEEAAFVALGERISKAIRHFEAEWLP